MKGFSGFNPEDFAPRTVAKEITNPDVTVFGEPSILSVLQFDPKKEQIPLVNRHNAEAMLPQLRLEFPCGFELYLPSIKDSLQDDVNKKTENAKNEDGFAYIVNKGGLANMPETPCIPHAMVMPRDGPKGKILQSIKQSAKVATDTSILVPFQYASLWGALDYLFGEEFTKAMMKFIKGMIIRPAEGKTLDDIEDTFPIIFIQDGNTHPNFCSAITNVMRDDSYGHYGKYTTKTSLYSVLYNSNANNEDALRTFKECSKGAKVPITNYREMARYVRAVTQKYLRGTFHWQVSGKNNLPEYGSAMSCVTCYNKTANTMPESGNLQWFHYASGLRLTVIVPIAYQKGSEKKDPWVALTLRRFSEGLKAALPASIVIHEAASGKTYDASGKLIPEGTVTKRMVGAFVSIRPRSFKEDGMKEVRKEVYDNKSEFNVEGKNTGMTKDSPTTIPVIPAQPKEVLDALYKERVEELGLEFDNDDSGESARKKQTTNKSIKARQRDHSETSEEDEEEERTTRRKKKKRLTKN